MSNCVVPMATYEKPKTDDSKKKRSNPFASVMATAAPAQDDGKKITLYVAGPVSGHKDLNRESFEAAKAILEHYGYNAIIPHEFVDADTDWLDAIESTLLALRFVDGVAFLDSWRESDGAIIECYAARHLGLPRCTVMAWVVLSIHPDELEKVCQRGANRENAHNVKLSELYGVLSGETETDAASPYLE